MKHFLLAVLLLTFAPAFAADTPPPAPQPPPLKTYPVALTPNQMQHIVQAQLIAAQICQQSDAACAAASDKTEIFNLFKAALQPATKQEKPK